MRVLSVQFLGTLKGKWNGLTQSLFGIVLRRSQGSGKTSQDSISHELDCNYFKKNSPVMFMQGCSVLMLSSYCAFTLVSSLLLLFFDFCLIFYCMMIGLSRNLICMKVWSYWTTYKRPHATRQTEVFSKISPNFRSCWLLLCSELGQTTFLLFSPFSCMLLRALGLLDYVTPYSFCKWDGACRKRNCMQIHNYITLAAQLDVFRK